MRFSSHSALEGRHARLSPSSYHWLNYDDEKFDRWFVTSMAAADGTRLHEYAAMAIRLGIRQSRIKSTLNMYINDSIGFRLTPEQPLYYSENCFGHADACGFSKDTLRIFDYKSGTNPTSYRQLETYAALFCLEYMFNPFQITIILRIYQNNEFREVIADPDSITKIMETIKRRDRRIEELREEALS